MLLLLYFESLFTSTSSICGLYKGNEWLCSLNPMSYSWLSMTISRKRSKYARDHVYLNISAKDIIMQINFLIKIFHALLHFSEDLYEMCGRGRSHGSCQIASWIHIDFHTRKMCLSLAQASTSFDLLVVKLVF